MFRSSMAYLSAQKQDPPVFNFFPDDKKAKRVEVD